MKKKKKKYKIKKKKKKKKIKRKIIGNSINNYLIIHQINFNKKKSSRP